MSKFKKRNTPLLLVTARPRLLCTRFPTDQGLMNELAGRNSTLALCDAERYSSSLVGLLSFIPETQANTTQRQEWTAVLSRLPTQPNSRIDELLPHNWKPEVAGSAGTQATPQLTDLEHAAG